jgi:hypothetical protein
LKFDLAISDFLVPGVFGVVQAPSEVIAESESSAKDVEVIIRQRRTAPIEWRQFPGGVPTPTPDGKGAPSTTPPPATIPAVR